MKLYSLRKATFVSLLAPMLLSFVLVAGAGLLSAKSAISVLRDHEMEQEAAFLQMLASHEAAEGEALGVVRSTDTIGFNRPQARGMGFRIWANGNIMTEVGELPRAGSVPPPEGFTDIIVDRVAWRRYATVDHTRSLIVETVEPTAIRTNLSWNMARSLISSMLLLIGVVTAISIIRLSSALRPLSELSTELDNRDSRDLSPLKGLRMPREVAPLVEAVNDLMYRLGRAIAREREFADNAAHELRTPLAVLKVRAQATRKTLSGHAVAEKSLEELVGAVDRTTGIIEQLLILGRITPGHSNFEPTNLSSLIEDVARIAASAAIEKNQIFEADIVPDLVVQGNANALSVVVRNLIDNAIRYTPAGGNISVNLSRVVTGHALLQIEDNGPRLGNNVDRAFERFERLGATEPGNGLGLSLVRDIVELHGGTVMLENRLSAGLLCQVRFAAT